MEGFLEALHRRLSLHGLDREITLRSKIYRVSHSLLVSCQSHLFKLNSQDRVITEHLLYPEHLHIKLNQSNDFEEKQLQTVKSF